MRADVGQRMRDQGLAPEGWGNGPGERYGAHHHPYDKVIAVERGSIRFGLPGSHDSIELAPGDRLDLPAGTIHDALVGPIGVGCLEAHLPAGSLEGPLRRPADTW
jgi:mannose-6-phosphate isomerase-like protein (cupin superfamily)